MTGKKIIESVEEIEFAHHKDYRGVLVPIEGENDVDFPIRRIYFITEVPNDCVRGKHAHIDLKQVLLCVKGSCTIDLENGVEQASVTLRENGPGIYIHGLVWRDMRLFSPDCVLMAIVDKKYDRADYILDYEQFRSIASGEEKR